MYSLIYFPRPFNLYENTICDSEGKTLFVFSKPYSDSPLQMQEVLECLNSDEDKNTDEDYDLTLNDDGWHIENNGKEFISLDIWDSLVNVFDKEKAHQIHDEFNWWIIKKLTKTQK